MMRRLCLLSLCATIVALPACSGSHPTPAQSETTAQSLTRPNGASTGIEFDNNWRVTIHPGNYTPIGCPWGITQPPYPVVPGGEQHTVLVYDATCIPNEPFLWTVSYGADLSRPATICTWTVSHPAVTRFSYSVKNTPRTKCSFAYSGNEEHFYYDLRRRRP